MNLKVTLHSDISIYEQIKQQIKEHILNGDVKPGHQMPSVRKLAKDLSVGIITVKRAYDDLVLDEFLISKPGKGFYVCSLNPKKIQDTYKTDIEEKLKSLKPLIKQSAITQEELINLIKKVLEEE